MLKRLHLFAAIFLCVFGAQAQPLTDQQLATVRAACFADAPCASSLAAGNAIAVWNWANGATATKAWLTAAPIALIEEAPTYTAYDSLIAGKRDSWVLFLKSSRDFTKAKVRNWVVDVWGAATAGSNAEAVLLAGTVSATAAQVALGGTVRTTGTVSALDRVWTGMVGEIEARRLVFQDNGSIWTP